MATKDNDTDPSTPRARRTLSMHPAAPGDPPSAERQGMAAEGAPAAEQAGAPDAAAATHGQPEATSGPEEGESALVGSARQSSVASAAEKKQSSAMPDERPNETDPGVGPPAPVRKLPPQSIGVVVPSPGSPARTFPPPIASKKDSIELLLAGLADTRPDRTRTAPQTDGEAAVVYHAEHAVRVGSSPSVQPPRVLVERPPTPRAIPLAAHAQRTRARLMSAAESTTAVTEKSRVDAPLVRRTMIALVAGLFVVIVIFGTLRSVTFHRDAEDTVSIAPPAAVPVSPMPLMPPVPPAVSAVAPPTRAAPEPAQSDPRPSAAPQASASAAAEPSATGVVSAASAPPRPPTFVRRRRMRPLMVPMPSATASSVGEFKTSF
ncbi:MAG: hypothetical protein ABSF69_21075 [Polyangiaceae bacterium]|jgi:hypothetical protein